MNMEWSNFLKQTGAVLEADRVQHFGDPERELRAALTSDLCCDRSDWGLIATRGPDTEIFLQGQLTCDVRQITLERSLPGAYCSPKGRILASVRLFQRDETTYLELPKPLVAPTLSRLRKYVLMAKTTLEDASDALARFGVTGPNAATLLHATLGVIPESANSVVHVGIIDPESVTMIRLPGPIPRFELHGPAQELAGIWNALRPNVAPAGAEPWRLLDILAGVPTVYPETTEAFVPQMTNLQLLQGVSFQKGCYTGQEVVARTHYLGKLKRRMYLARVESSTLPHPGDPLFSPQAGASQSAGRIADACRHPEGGYAVLAVALIECAEQGVLQLGNASGPVLRLEPMPYSFEEAVA